MDLGPAFAHGTLEVESYMSYLKSLITSRKNLLEGFARLHQYEEQVFWWTLTADKLKEHPATKRKFTWSTAGHGNPVTKVLEAHLQPLDSIIGLWKADGLLPPLVTEWLAFFASEKELGKKRKGR